MKTFNVYKHPTYGIEAVKVGFSWPAFFFGFFWLLVKKLWGLAGLWFAAYIVFALIETVTGQSGEGDAQALVYLILAAGYFALWLIPAFKGNKWRQENLSKRGYEQLATIQAETPDAAIAQVAKLATVQAETSDVAIAQVAK
ncbi:DUF2628 domain-containing protein [Nitrosomonas sp. Nm34]|uniref:DUF2628 domain-containing protein n=1 Tax=Nitrosomonas sp. Nm34 TaxID=1881055 RepID=UPI0008E6D69D|nr:DUF2628 domain-containing protein [Nitrosomonas sp. Nm34]SFI39621.1 Protein of unknown function [Nitrosomonas sp. Nm34]